MLKNEWLLDLLACPRCKNELHTTDENHLVCGECRVSFPVNAAGRPDLRLTKPEELSPQRKSTSVIFKTATRIRKGLDRRLRTKLYGWGDAVECCFCGWTGGQFLPAGSKQLPNRLCPQCGSLERYRALYLYLKEHSRIMTDETYLLDVATKPCFRKFCERHPNVKYVSSDLMTDGAMVFSDLTEMGMASGKFDIIACLHVMEHVRDDQAAGEMRRLLKPNGFALVMVPLRGDRTFEDPRITPDQYELSYGQYDHVRFYGMDISRRMEAAGLNVEVIDILSAFSPEILDRHALYGDDRYFFRLSRSA